ncbi:glycine betaine ABC transporter substrate-binding protein [Salsuginibacillus kocurii]|uniref:glycine betaine ABC transporter substrate-binding protein n=1 Tax=Salsuginibacillus kocurii TaxID=427078 RepID=UPI000366918C|nr:glycine betaine ABC transporter substrate-binding protein [Salsuginibacillus kocurii]
MKKHTLLWDKLFIVSTLVLSACGEEESADDTVDPAEDEEEVEEESGDEEAEEDAPAPEDTDPIEIGYNNWAENIAVSNMWKLLLEEEGYEVELTNLEKTGVFAGVASGDLDIGTEVWLPHTDEPHIEEYGDDFAIQDLWYENTELGLVVPEYMEDIESIEDLHEYEEELNQNIVGIEPGAALMENTEVVLEEYELDYDLQSSSEQAMMTELDSAYQNEEPIVVTLWSPHWAFADYDLKYLEDTEGIYGEADDIVFITREGFDKEYAPVIEWMNNSFFDDESLGELMSIINDLEDPEEGAAEWIEENRELVDEWID